MRLSPSTSEKNTSLFAILELLKQYFFCLPFYLWELFDVMQQEILCPCLRYYEKRKKNASFKTYHTGQLF